MTRPAALEYLQYEWPSRREMRVLLEAHRARAAEARREGGRRGGLASRRPPDDPDRDVAARALADRGFSQRRIAAALGCSRGAVIRALGR